MQGHQYNPVSLKGKRILVADDDHLSRALVKEILEAADFQVILACNGEEAYQLFKSEQPDLLILDLLMPKATGFDVLKLIRQESRVPVLAMTAIYKTVDQLHLVRELGADGFVEKPFSAEQLVFRVETLLLESFRSKPEES